MFSAISFYVFIVIFIASVLQTLTGFGFALIATPLLAFAIDPKEAIFLVLFVGTIARIFMLYKTWNEGEFSPIILIFAASIIGALPGVFVLRFIDAATLKIFISIVLILATGSMFTNIKLNFHHRTLSRVVVGLLSGFLGATTSFSGPPIALYMIHEYENKVNMRANLVRYFLLANGATLFMLIFAGNLSFANSYTNIVVSLPAILLSWYAGDKMFHLVDVTLFKRITLTVISLSALTTLAMSVL